MKKLSIIMFVIFSFLQAKDYLSIQQEEIFNAKHYPILYKLDCLSRNKDLSCYYLGMAYSNNDLFLTNRYFIKACELGITAGCENAAITFSYGKLLNPQKSIFYFKKACLDNAIPLGKSCRILGIIFSTTKLNKTKILDNPDYKKALFYLKKGCNLKDSEACWNLGVLYNNGMGVRKNKRLSNEYFIKSCELKFKDGCENILSKDMK